MLRLLLLSIIERGVLKSPTLIVDLATSPSKSILYFEAALFSA